mmetsp:Transcript_10875/g.23019  ORF Transcript_10875/g.23019 Transcript_10875/m.23019 type:complete len:84 (-) Transcript_10875:1264-1515(-)
MIVQDQQLCPYVLTGLGWTQRSREYSTIMTFVLPTMLLSRSKYLVQDIPASSSNNFKPSTSLLSAFSIPNMENLLRATLLEFD